MKILKRILYFLLCMYILILPFSNENFKIAGMTFPGDVILALAIVCLIIMLIISKIERVEFIDNIKDFFHNPFTLMISIFLFLMCFSVIYASDKKIAISESARFASYICLFYLIKYEVKETKIYRLLINVYLVTTSLLCIFGIYQFFTGALNSRYTNNYIYGVHEKIASTLTNPNNFAAYLILCVFPVFMLIIYEKSKKKKFVYSILFMLILANVTLTFSRNAFLAIVLGCIILAIVYSKKLIIIFVPLAGIAAVIPQIRTRFLEVGNAAMNASRIKLWETALMMFKEHPIFGVGNGNYVSLYDSYVKKYRWLSYGYTHFPAHDSYLKVLAELGIIGIVVFLIFLFILAKNLYKYIKNKQYSYFSYYYIGFFTSFLVFLFMNISDNLFFVPKTTSYFWIMTAIFYGISYKKNSINSGGSNAERYTN